MTFRKLAVIVSFDSSVSEQLRLLTVLTVLAVLLNIGHGIHRFGHNGDTSKLTDAPDDQSKSTDTKNHVLTVLDILTVLDTFRHI